MRKAVKIEIIRQNLDLFTRTFKKGFETDHHKSENGLKIVTLMRTRLGYACTTFNYDILWTAYLTWKENFNN